MSNVNLNIAKINKNDEFYTKYEDIEKELKHYRGHFKNKIIYCNADNPKSYSEHTSSNFWKYFYNNFHTLKLKRLIATYISEDISYKYEYDGKDTAKTKLKENGDFRSNEAIDILKLSDIVVTNPPFSLYREYIAQLMKYRKDFLIIGNFNSVSYKEIFPLIKDEKIWLGHTSPKEFIEPNENTKKFGNIVWFTNLDTDKSKSTLKLIHTYKGNESKYPKYDNYDAINVDRVNLIPKDYDGIMGVPITFLNKHQKEQFEILGIASGNSRKTGLHYSVAYTPHKDDRGGTGVINGKRKYVRLFIRRKEKSKDPIYIYL